VRVELGDDHALDGARADDVDLDAVRVELATPSTTLTSTRRWASGASDHVLDAVRPPIMHPMVCIHVR
jgi:hypothetical protein